MKKGCTEDQVGDILAAYGTGQTLRIRKTHFPISAFTTSTNGKIRLRGDRPNMNPSWELPNGDDNDIANTVDNSNDNGPTETPAPLRSTESVAADNHWGVVDKLQAKSAEVEYLKQELQECKEENESLRSRISELEKEARILQSRYVTLLGSTCLSYSRCLFSYNVLLDCFPCQQREQFSHPG